METEGDLQSLLIHRASLLPELQITEPVLQFQSAELLQEHSRQIHTHPQQSHRSQNSNLWNIDLNAKVFSFNCISQRIWDETHPAIFLQ